MQAAELALASQQPSRLENECEDRNGETSEAFPAKLDALEDGEMKPNEQVNNPTSPPPLAAHG